MKTITISKKLNNGCHKVSKKKFNQYNKGRFWHYKGHMLWKHHAYQHNRKSNQIMLCYDVDGNECYFKTWAAAKAYVRKIAHLPKQDNILDFPF